MGTCVQGGCPEGIDEKGEDDTPKARARSRVKGGCFSDVPLLSSFLPDLKPLPGSASRGRAGRREQDQVLRLGSVDVTGLMLKELSAPLVPLWSPGRHSPKRCSCSILCPFNVDIMTVSVL